MTSLQIITSFFLCTIFGIEGQSNNWIYNLTTREAADLVASEFRFGYEAYREYAWGYDDLLPLTFNGSNWSQYSMMITPIDSLGTMALMNLTHLINATMEELLCNGSEPKFTFLRDQNINMFEIVIRVLGGLVSAYHFVSSPIHKECIKALAIELGDGIYETTFNNQINGANIEFLPWIDINILNKTVNKKWNASAPAGLASNIIEYAALSYIANDGKYYTAAKNTMRKLFDLRSIQTDLVGALIQSQTNDINNIHFLWPDNSAHIDAQIDSFYEYMIKCYLLTGDEECKKWWDVSLKGIYDYLLYEDENNNLWFQRVDMFNGTTFGNDSTGIGSTHRSYTYSLHAHFMAATLVLDDELDIAISNQEANHFMWELHGITPFVYDFHNDEIIAPQYDLNPELFESNYYLYVKTNESIYLQRAYEYLNALITYTKCTNVTQCAGYSTIEDVTTMERKNSCPSFWFAESLKFLYLTFMVNDNDNPLVFDDYIFTTEAHPVPRAWGKVWDRMEEDDGLETWMIVVIVIVAIVVVVMLLFLVRKCCKKNKNDYSKMNELAKNDYGAAVTESNRT